MRHILIIISSATFYTAMALTPIILHDTCINNQVIRPSGEFWADTIATGKLPWMNRGFYSVIATNADSLSDTALSALHIIQTGF